MGSFSFKSEISWLRLEATTDDTRANRHAAGPPGFDTAANRRTNCLEAQTGNWT